MKGKRLLVSLLVTTALVLGLTLPAAAQVEPEEVIEEMAPGDSIEITKTVTTPAIPPNPDIYFMSDTTGSMGGVIDAVADNADAILAAIVAAQPTAQFGVGSYRDYPYDALPPFYHQQAITSDTVAVSAAIGAWAAGGGGDGPEGQFYALDRLADGTGIGWRDIGTKIVVWFGDAPAHDPVPMAATGLGYDIDEARVTADLVDAGIKVIAISVDTGYYESGTDDDPLDAGGDYATAYGITENGTAGQASRIATATSGAYLFAATPEEAAAAVIAGIEAVTTDVWWEVTYCDDGLSVTFDHEVELNVPGDTEVTFIETISIAGTEPPCKKYTAIVTFYANTYPEEGIAIGEEKITVGDITPPKVWVDEAVNPSGKKVPPAGSSTLPGAKGGINDDGFYQLFAEDNCDPFPYMIICYWDPEAEAPDGTTGWYVAVRDKDGNVFMCSGGTVIKLTQAPGAPPNFKKMGSSKGKAGEVDYHITVPGYKADLPTGYPETIVVAYDASGNSSWALADVPPPPK